MTMNQICGKDWTLEAKEDNKEIWHSDQLKQFEIFLGIKFKSIIHGRYGTNEDFNIRLGKRIDKENREYFYGI